MYCTNVWAFLTFPSIKGRLAFFWPLIAILAVSSWSFILILFYCCTVFALFRWLEWHFDRQIIELWGLTRIQKPRVQVWRFPRRPLLFQETGKSFSVFGYKGAQKMSFVSEWTSARNSRWKLFCHVMGKRIANGIWGLCLFVYSMHYPKGYQFLF